MKGLRANTLTDRSTEPGWSGVVLLSLLLHLGVLSLLLFAPGPYASRRANGPTVYEVNLVDLPPAKPKAPARSVPSETPGKTVPTTKKTVPTKRISAPPEPEKPVIIGKRTVARKKTVPKKRPKPKKPKISPTKLIDRAVAKVKRNVRTRKRDDQRLDKAISRIQNRVGQAEAPASAGGGMAGISIRIYQMEVEERVKSNWQYPVALTSPSKRKGLVSTVVVEVRQDGAILKSWFTDRSGNAVFDASVMKAVDRSNPLPPFPEGYNKRRDEVVIRFDLSELKDN